MRNKIGRMLAALVLVVAGMAMCASPAQAITCPDGFLCMFNGSDGSASLYVVLPSNLQRSRCYQLPTSATNRTSYIWNRSNNAFSVFDGGSCQTLPGTIHPQSQGRMTGVWDNTISSFFKQ